jgi:hypothetical protein
MELFSLLEPIGRMLCGDFLFFIVGPSICVFQWPDSYSCIVGTTCRVVGVRRNTSPVSSNPAETDSKLSPVLTNKSVLVERFLSVLSSISQSLQRTGSGDPFPGW